MKRVLLIVAGFVMLLGLMAAPVQSKLSATLTLQAQLEPEAKTFTGTILKNGDHFVLSDSATRSRYTLDDSEKATPYEGRRVTVTGTVEIASSLIHIESIQEIA
jgi:hypothetical protein